VISRRKDFYAITLYIKLALSFNDKFPPVELYRRKKTRRTYKKRWLRKKTKDKKGFTRYSTGPKWAGQYDFEKPAFWRTWQPELIKKFRDDEMLPCGYSKNQTWIALCKSWNGFLFAKRGDNHEDMKQYAMQIRSLQNDFGFPKSHFDMFTPEEMEWMDRESDVEAKEKWYASCV
jgi:hypothetical protein